ncbi:hypothetical protein [Erysipelothrix tonsillarum]|uniref:hypothetical protein n=1 Tax=Erysipelothrix tonsillarum TaxID=38402 RepID=UPI0003763341|nr:hypothetical protein [Erysipelothrix tonsillarum]
MSKYDELLNELVYQIDDVVYNFYSQSNEIIATKNGQERLLTFRDKTLNTINDMNVRSLEIIADFKNSELIQERAEHLLQKNKDIVNSSLDVLRAAPERNEFLDDLGNLATGIYESAKTTFQKVKESETFDRFKESAMQGLKKVQKGLDDFAKHPNVVKGTEIVKEKTKEAVDAGSQIVKETSKSVNDWVSEQELKAKAEKVSKEVHEGAETVKVKVHDGAEKVEDYVDQAADTVEDKAKEFEADAVNFLDTLEEESDQVSKDMETSSNIVAEAEKQVRELDKKLDDVKEDEEL